MSLTNSNGDAGSPYEHETTAPMQPQQPPTAPHGLDRYVLGNAILFARKKHGQDSWCSIADEVLPLIAAHTQSAVAAALEQRDWPKGTTQFPAATIIAERDDLKLKLASAVAELEITQRDAGLYAATLKLSANQLGCDEHMVDHAVAKVLRERDEARAGLIWVTTALTHSASGLRFTRKASIGCQHLLPMNRVMADFSCGCHERTFTPFLP